jgi:hypothetical protein
LKPFRRVVKKRAARRFVLILVPLPRRSTAKTGRSRICGNQQAEEVPGMLSFGVPPSGGRATVFS